MVSGLTFTLKMEILVYVGMGEDFSHLSRWTREADLMHIFLHLLLIYRPQRKPFEKNSCALGHLVLHNADRTA